MKASIIFLLASCGSLLAQGPLTPPGPPGPTQKSLQEIWDKVSSLEEIALTQQGQISLLQQQNALLQQQNTLLLDAAGVGLHWQFQTVTANGSISGRPSLKFSPSGTASIAYCESPGGHVKLAKKTATGWDVTTVDNAGGASGSPELGFLPDGTAVIAYHGNAPSVGLRFARFNGSAWDIVLIVTGDAGYEPSLAIAPDGNPAVAFIGGAVEFSHFHDGSWHTQTAHFLPEGAENPSLAFGPDGEPAIAYTRLDDSGLHYVKRSSGVWSDSVIAEHDPESEGTDEFSAPCLAFAPDGQPAVCYDYYSADGRLVYAAFDPASEVWQKTDVASGSDWGFEGVLRFQPNGEPAISYSADANSDDYPSNLAYAIRKGTWSIEYLGTSVADRYESGRASLAFSPGGLPAIAFSNGELRFAAKGAFVAH